MWFPSGMVCIGVLTLGKVGAPERVCIGALTLGKIGAPERYGLHRGSDLRQSRGSQTVWFA